jgi:branched-chain amino acid transport system permease protein
MFNPKLKWIASETETIPLPDGLAIALSRRQAALKSLATLAGLVTLCIIPFWISPYNTFQLTLVLINSIVLLGLNLLTGYSGQISIGHGAFYAIGAYLTAILVTRYGVPYPATVLLAAVVCFFVGILFGLPALRLDGHYLALATFSLAIAVPSLLKAKFLEWLTNGVEGIRLPTPKVPLGLPLTKDQWLYFLTLFFSVVAIVITRNLLHGKVGRALIAVRDHPIAARAMGIDVAFVKTVTFGISVALAATAGALSAIVVRFVAPESFDVFVSISFLVGIVVGGLATIPGCIIGGAFILLVPNLAQEVSKAAPWALYGALMIAFVMLLPQGIWGGVLSLWRFAKRQMRAGGQIQALTYQRSRSPKSNHEETQAP